MQIIVLLIILFVILLLAPVLGAVLYYRTHKGEILHINQDRVRDARYFGKSFRTLVESHLSETEGNTIQLSRNEEFIDGDTQDTYEETVDNLVICREKDYHAPSGVKKFLKEIYAGRNVVLNQGQVEYRAVYAKKNMIIGNGSSITRWADADGTVAVYDNCSLGHSVSSARRLSIGKNCSFKRLYAPEICLGQYPDSIADPTEGKDPKIYRLPVEDNKERNMRYISKEMINEDGVVDFSVLSWKNLIITEKIIVQGDVRSHSGVKLCDGAVVCGNVFAEKDVILGKNACVLGNVFSQENIYLEEGAVIGQQGRICSAVARGNITFSKNNFVFGYVGCEGEGQIAADQKGKADIQASPGDVEYLEDRNFPSKLVFKDLYDYEHVDQQGFRNQRAVTEADIPQGAVKIPRSMFFRCVKLKRIVLPDSIQEIGDFAFADCRCLKELPGFEYSHLTVIGTSAFENCRNLEKIMIPATVETIEGAAFGGCGDLKEIVFAEGSGLTKIGDHCFRGCRGLRTIRIPERVTEIGVSAFLGCDNLVSVAVPEHLRDTPGIAELPPEKVEIYNLPEMDSESDKAEDMPV